MSGERDILVEIRTAPAILAVTSVFCVLPMLLAAMMLKGGGYWEAALLVAFAAYWWTTACTIRVVATRHEVTFFRYWRAQWRVETAYTDVTSGLGGDIPMLPAYLIADRRHPKTRHAIVTTQFRRADLARLVDFIRSNNGGSK